MVVVIRTSEIRARLHVPATDPIEVEIGSVAEDEIVSSTFFLEYKASNGAISSREIIVRSVYWVDGILSVNAVCLMRRAVRSFRVDRMQSLINARTGEVIDDISGFFAEITDEGEGQHAKLPERQSARKEASSSLTNATKTSRCQREALRNLVRPAAIILMYMARADHEVAPAEVGVLEDLIRDGRTHLGMSQDDSDRRLLMEMTSLSPSGNLLTRALKSVLASGFPADLPKRVTRMARADGVMAPEEESACREIIATLKRGVV